MDLKRIIVKEVKFLFQNFRYRDRLIDSNKGRYDIWIMDRIG